MFDAYIYIKFKVLSSKFKEELAVSGKRLADREAGAEEGLPPGEAPAFRAGDEGNP